MKRLIRLADFVREEVVKCTTLLTLRSLFCLVPIALNISFVGLSALHAQTTTSWINTSSTGNWFITTNWNNGLPSSSPPVNAVVNNGTTAQIPVNETAAATPTLTIGSTVPGGTVPGSTVE